MTPAPEVRTDELKTITIAGGLLTLQVIKDEKQLAGGGTTEELFVTIRLTKQPVGTAERLSAEDLAALQSAFSDLEAALTATESEYGGV